MKENQRSGHAGQSVDDCQNAQGEVEVRRGLGIGRDAVGDTVAILLALRIVEDLESNDKRIEQNDEGEDDGVDLVFDDGTWEQG